MRFPKHYFVDALSSESNLWICLPHGTPQPFQAALQLSPIVTKTPACDLNPWPKKHRPAKQQQSGTGEGINNNQLQTCFGLILLDH
jgi:hypothetical protein